MSTDWDVYCVDCKVRHGFDDCNHWEAEMLVLCKHAAAIAGLVDLVTAGGNFSTPSLGFECGNRTKRIDPMWFRDHLGHNLQPINEYGAFMEQCPLYTTCTCCEASRRCVLTVNHAEPCSPKRSA